MERLSDGTPLQRLDLWDMDGEWGVEIDTDTGEWVPEDLVLDVVRAYDKYVAASRELRAAASRVYLWQRGKDDGEEMASAKVELDEWGDIRFDEMYESTICGCAGCAAYREG